MVFIIFLLPDIGFSALLISFKNFFIGISQILNLLNFSYGKVQIILSCCRLSIIMNCSDQRNTMFIHFSNSFFKRSLMIFNNYILITWYYPFCPSIRGFCIINTFHTCQI